MNNDYQYVPTDEDVRSARAELEAAVVGYRSPHPDLVACALFALTAAEHRATRAEAQSAIRGRAVVIYRERAREAEAAAADIWDEGWKQGMAYVVGMERGIDDDDLDHATTNPYERNENA